jgi:hypothetical protein
MKTLTLLVLATALVGCAPPYIPELDSALSLTRQMTSVGDIGSVSTSGSDNATNMRFYPTKPTAASLENLSVTSGFVVATTASNEYTSFVYLDSGGLTRVAQTNGSQVALPLAGADANYPLYQYEVAATTSTANLVIFKLDPADPYSSSAELVLATLPPDSVLSIPTVTSPATNPETKGMVGASIFPVSSIGENFSILGIVNVPPAQYNTNIGVSIDGVSTVLTAGTAPSLPPLPLLNRYLYYYNPATTTSYAESYTGGKWVCYQWPDLPATPTDLPILTGVNHRIDALLSNGYLLSAEGGTLRLYDATGTGTEVLAVSLSGLQFCYEAYVGDTPYAFFSLAMSVRNGRWAFKVYAIATSSLTDLQ